MSLLEDIFLQDEADEAQQLERVIEGDEYDERPRSRSATPESDENANREDEAEEDKRRVDPSSTKTKRVTKNPRFILNPARLTGPRGIQIIPEHFKDFKFKGKGHEKEDLDIVLKKLEHWAYRLYPKFQFEDCLKKIETLGKKRPVMVHLHKIRTDQFLSEDTVVQKDSSDDEAPAAPQEEDEFDKLLQQQIELARATPAPGSVKKVMDTPMKDRSPFTMPKATSSPSISDEQKERMIKNRKLAEERRLARLKLNSLDTSEKQDSTNNISGIIEVDEENVEANVTAKKNHRSFVIDSSDDECGITTVNQSVTVDVHTSKPIDEMDKDSNRPSEIVLESEKGNLDDIEMIENVKKNHDEETVEEMDEVAEKTHDENVVKIFGDVDKETGKNVEVIGQTNKVADEIIEINDDRNTVIKSNDSNVIIIDGNEDDPPTIVNEEPIIVGDDVNTENTNKSSSNIEKVNIDTIEQNTIAEKSNEQTEEPISIQNDSELNKSNKDVVNLEPKDNDIADEFAADIIDVDFSDDF